jgi:hypothetical protein
MIAGILKGDECLLRNTSGNVKIVNLLKTIPKIIFKGFFLNRKINIQLCSSKMSYVYCYYLITI